MKENLELLAVKEFKNYEDMYKVVDYVNKTLKPYDIVLGLSKKDEMDVITIYRETINNEGNVD